MRYAIALALMSAIGYRGISYDGPGGPGVVAPTAAATATGQVLQSGSGSSTAWSTATYPATTTINRILYSSAANIVAEAATCNNGVWTSSSAGVPTCATGFTVASGIVQITNNPVTMGNTATGMNLKADTSGDQGTVSVGSSVGRALHLVETSVYSEDCSTSDETNPLFAVHSATGCTTTKLKYTGLQHNDTDGIVSTGSGIMRLQPATKAVVLPLHTGTSLTEPTACAAGTVGMTVYADDTDDGAAAQICACIAITDSTYDWRKIDDLGTACSFF